MGPGERRAASSAGSVRTVSSGIIPLVLVAALVAYVLGPGAHMLDLGVPLPEVTIERVDFAANSEIHATIRNTGPIPVTIVFADVNDRIHPAAIEPDGYLGRLETAKVRIPFEWNEAEPYVIGITTSDGTRFEREIAAAAPAVLPSYDMISFFAVVGAYVGVIPVMIGMLWLPFMRRMGGSTYVFFLAVTVGLLLFLALDSIEEAVDVSQENLAGSFNGLMLLATSVVLSFLGLYYVGGRLSGGRGAARGTTAGGRGLRLARPVTIALMISVGIGLHNFGEGLAIGAAIGLGSIAFSTFLIVGFALHNVTEGLAIAAPLSKGSTGSATWLKLGCLGMVAGAPAIFGGWVGGFAYSPFASVIFLGVGAGAIFQVMFVLIRWIGRGDRDDGGGSGAGGEAGGAERDEASGAHGRDGGRSGGGGSGGDGGKSGGRGLSGAPFVSGIAVGMLIMYVTSIVV